MNEAGQITGNEETRKSVGGQPGKHSKVSAAETEKRITTVVSLLSGGITKGEIKRVMADTYGISARTCERYLSRARQILAEEIGKPKSELRGQVYGSYIGILRDKNARNSDKIMALKGIRRMLGLDEPVMVHTEVSGGTRDELTVRYEDMSEDELRELLAARTARLGRVSPELLKAFDAPGNGTEGNGHDPAPHTGN